MIHSYKVIARYAETDMMGVIHHSVYPIWAEAARTDILNASGYRYSEIENSGIMLPVTQISFKYKAPTFYEDEIFIKSAITMLDNRRLRIDYEMWREDILCVLGYSKHIFMNKTTRTAMRINQDVLENFKKYYFPEFQKLS